MLTSSPAAVTCIAVIERPLMENVPVLLVNVAPLRTISASWPLILAASELLEATPDAAIAALADA